MTDREPIATTNLDRYGNAALPWSRPHDLLAASANTSFFLGTVRPDGRRTPLLSAHSGTTATYIS